MKKQNTTDAKRAAANDKPENGKTEKAKVTASLRTVLPEPERYTIGSTQTVKRGFLKEFCDFTKKKGTVDAAMLIAEFAGHVARGPMVGVSTNYSRLSSLCRGMRSAWLGIADEKTTSALLVKVRQGLEIPMIPFMRTLAIEWWLRNLELFGIVQLDRAETRNTLRVPAQEDRQCS